MLKGPDHIDREARIEAPLPMDGAAAAPVWERVQRRLRAELGEDVYASWFRCLELAGFAPPVVTLSVPTKFLRNWIQQHYLEKILAHFARENEAIARIAVVVRVAGLRPAPPRGERPA
ncbi:MAG: hypothetical protein LDL22_09095, partial [Hyphomicrobiales bacterium]|nr:hypothetical protein [Hyphomicrobiales bacterium]